jgi:type I restriction enzyme R subunit
MAFNENTRVKIPAILHLTQLGYEYVSLKDAKWDINTNIFTDIFRESILRINAEPDFNRMEAEKQRRLKRLGIDEQPRTVPERSYFYNDANITEKDITNTLSELKELLDYEDLGRAFYNRLVSTMGIRLIDFENFSNNSFHVCTELTCKNGEDEFRPDITILINGMPLVFIEVKKPNNTEGCSDGWYFT